MLIQSSINELERAIKTQIAAVEVLQDAGRIDDPDKSKLLLEASKTLAALCSAYKDVHDTKYQ